jgi:methylenetetrahydrofolate dehydrogenase (NADP+) / methenyltetrahydrofolate cyclohydrolase
MQRLKNMTATILDGKMLSAKVLDELRALVAARVAAGKRAPCLALLRVGNDPASEVYVEGKRKAAASVGIESRVVHLTTATQKQVEAQVDAWAHDAGVDGILVQSPLPAGICEEEVFNRVPPHKDVDGFSARNLGMLLQERPEAFVACTPAGILRILAEYGIPTRGKHAVVIGRSLIVGKPLAILLGQKGGANASVTICHSASENLAGIAKSADILISAVGRPGLVTADWVKSGATVIDVGITRVADATRKSGSRLAGDVDFDAVKEVAGAITPVPGGVGPMTIAMLMSNTVKACEMRGM